MGMGDIRGGSWFGNVDWSHQLGWVDVFPSFFSRGGLCKAKLTIHLLFLSCTNDAT